MKKTLTLLRHAKAEAGSQTQDDHVRALNQQGIEACEAMGRYMASLPVAPQLVLCSTATRAQNTWHLIQKHYKVTAPEEDTDKLYLASPNEIIAQLMALPEKVASVMVVGHNPGLHQLCLMLSAQGDDELLDRLHMKFPTCALAQIDLGDIAWKDIKRANGTLKTFMTPKMLSPVLAED